MMFAKATEALEPRSRTGEIVAWITAALVTVMVVSQLFEFEDFIPTMMTAYGFGGNNGVATVLCCLIVFFEVFSLPFLLRMPLSLLMRWVSLGFGVTVSLAWLVLSFSALIAGTVANSGILGSKLQFTTGIVACMFSIILVGLAGWAAWGLWPTKKQ